MILHDKYIDDAKIGEAIVIYNQGHIWGVKSREPEIVLYSLVITTFKPKLGHKRQLEEHLIYLSLASNSLYWGFDQK